MMKLLALVLAVSLAAQAQAKAVFAHFMIGNTEYYTNSDFLNEMRMAQEAHIDGFVLNMAYLEPANDHSLPIAFDVAGSIGFKLLFSFDYAGNGDWPKSTVVSYINKYKSHAAYWKHGSQPLVSTFEGYKRAADWPSIKQETGCYFMPSWSSMGAKRAVRTGVTDGLFSWGAWPEGASSTDMEIDASYLIFLNGSSYMMPISPWFFTNLPGYNKNWLWRGDSLWHDRWNLVFSIVSQNQWVNQPEYLQIISWNDFGESHYIGPLNDKAYTAFDIGKAPYNYVKDMPHDAWRMLLPYAIDTYKNGIATITQEVLVAWYRRSPAGACSSGGTTGNTAAQLQTETAPGALSQDKIFFSAVLTSVLVPRVTIGGQQQLLSWDDVPFDFIGMYHGSFAYNGRLGNVLIELIDASSGAVMASLQGASLTDSCEKGITNWNPWVGGVKTSRSVNKSPTKKLADQKCMRGKGRAGFEELCDFSCTLGYCPPGPCTCLKLGDPKLDMDPKNVDGYPLPGSDCTYKGLCSHACNYGFCPSAFCTTNPSAKDKCVIPPEEPDPVEQTGCTSGSGKGNLAGLCDFACGRGFCPESSCTCTGQGPVITPPIPTNPPGFPAAGLGKEYAPLCDFVCARGYCPEGACTYQIPSDGGGDGGWEVEPGPISDKFKSVDCVNEGVVDHGQNAEWRWSKVMADDAVDWVMNEWITQWGTGNPKDTPPIQNGLSLPEFVSNKFHGRQNMECHKLAPANGCREFYQCHDTNWPAGYFVLNSFVHLSNMHWNFFDAMSRTRDEAADDVTKILDTFSPSVGKGPLPLAIILDIVLFAYGGAAAPFWNVAIKRFSYFNDNKNVHGTLKDAVNSIVANSIAIVKDSTKADSRITQATTLTTQLNLIVDIWFDTADSAALSVFGSPLALERIIKGGKLLSEKVDIPSTKEIKSMMTDALYAMLIPMAWKMSGKDINPFILDGNVACDKYISTEFLSKSDQDKTRTCVDGRAYFLVGATDSQNSCRHLEPIGGECDPFVPLPGANRLDGSTWGKLTRDDFVHGSVNTFRAAGNKNGAEAVDPVTTAFLNGVQDIGVKAPGIFRLSVCGAQEAHDNYWGDFWGLKKGPNYPCK